jgi:hypothetical protein
MNLPVTLSIIISLALTAIPSFGLRNIPVVQPSITPTSAQSFLAVPEVAVASPKAAVVRVGTLPSATPKAEVQKFSPSALPAQVAQQAQASVQVSRAPEVVPTPSPTSNPSDPSCPSDAANTNWLWTPPGCSVSSDAKEKIHSGMSGVITIGPSCPVVKLTSSGEIDENCADKPYQTTMYVYSGDQEVAQFTSDKKGRYTVALAPGTYTVKGSKDLKSMTHVDPQTITVVAGQYATANFAFDNGMR